MTSRQQLLVLCERRGKTVNQLLDYLQDRGLISDNIVGFRDLPQSEAARILPVLATGSPQ